ncbi:uncharacterized protein LOC133712842 [Rosa rugosa]|uniref:uncharacterized protein LOC133712842 n=1 Tax=Rosa rugosa TaxID=74645 RepID=UPI002B40B592|nr:uncharacterized protein LOC133712842 [Rosa rugosa]
MKFNASDIMKTSNIDQREDEYCVRLRSIGAYQNEPSTKKDDPICKSSNKEKSVAAVLSHSSEKEHHIDNQLGKERSFSDKESMWLSSDCSSPSAFFREYRWSGSFHLSLDEHKNVHTDLMDEKVATRLLSSATNDAKPRESLCDDSTSCGNSSAPLRSTPSSSQILDLERIGYQVSLLNLDGDDYKWIPDTEVESYCLQYAFHSPSYKTRSDHEAEFSNSCISTATEAQNEKPGYCFPSEQASKAVEVEESNTNEPLFWPFAQKIDWSAEATWNCFSMSPRKSIATIGTPLDSIILRRYRGSMDLKQERRRKLVFSLGSTTSKIPDMKQSYTKGIKDIREICNAPSRLSRVTKRTEKENILEHKNQKVTIKNPVVMAEDIMEEDFESKQLGIEMFLGLDEFDGHEGIDSTFNKDDFSLNISFC